MWELDHASGLPPTVLPISIVDPGFETKDYAKLRAARRPAGQAGLTTENMPKDCPCPPYPERGEPREPLPFLFSNLNR
jgi:hypothetical protein